MEATVNILILVTKTGYMHRFPPNVHICQKRVLEESIIQFIRE
jgi:hypothetical protein